jgi:hypothetical protein
MVVEVVRASSPVAKALLLIGCLAAASSPARAQDPGATSPAAARCTVDLARPGTMKDILSNALLRGLKRPEADVSAFLRHAATSYATGQELMRAAARHFEVDEARLAAEVERFKHCNCAHDEVVAAGSVELTPFARNVTLHVVLHELGHALVREFDLPVLGNEETMADAFATHFLTAHLPDRAVAVLEARTTSLMIEAREVRREEWTVSGEHDNDARRAFQIAALAVAADPAKYASVAKCVAMSDRDVRSAVDYGAEIHRSWRRILAPLWMPEGARSNEARVVCVPAGQFVQPHAAALVAELESAVVRFDWHSQVTIRFAVGDGGARWDRGTRTVNVPSAYLRRFVEQGKAAKH